VKNSKRKSRSIKFALNLNRIKGELERKESLLTSLKAKYETTNLELEQLRSQNAKHGKVNFISYQL